MIPNAIFHLSLTYTLPFLAALRLFVKHPAFLWSSMLGFPFEGHVVMPHANNLTYDFRMLCIIIRNILCNCGRHSFLHAVDSTSRLPHLCIFEIIFDLALLLPRRSFPFPGCSTCLPFYLLAYTFEGNATDTLSFVHTNITYRDTHSPTEYNCRSLQNVSQSQCLSSVYMKEPHTTNLHIHVVLHSQCLSSVYMKEPHTTNLHIHVVSHSQCLSSVYMKEPHTTNLHIHVVSHELALMHEIKNLYSHSAVNGSQGVLHCSLTQAFTPTAAPLHSSNPECPKIAIAMAITPILCT